MNEKIAQFKEVVDLFPEDPTPRFGLAAAYLEGGAFDSAALEFLEVIRLKPDYTAAYRGLGRALERSGRLDEARAAYQQGIDIGQRTRDLQTVKEMEVFLRRLGERGQGGKPAELRLEPEQGHDDRAEDEPVDDERG